MEWTEETIARLRGLWAEGHSTAEIGRRMGVSKNAVVGKAHRLSLPARPSPIRRMGSDMAVRLPAPRRVVGPTLPPLPEQPREAAAHRPPPRPPEAPVRTAPPPEPPRAAAPLRPVSVPRSSARVSACCWPIGEPGKPSFRFCNGEALANKPYCAEHAQLAYVKIRDRREEAA